MAVAVDVVYEFRLYADSNALAILASGQFVIRSMSELSAPNEFCESAGAERNEWKGRAGGEVASFYK